MKHEFVPLTPELARTFYGAQPARTHRGYALLRDGRPIVVWGLIREPYRWVLFSDASPEARAGSFGARRLVVLGARKLLAMLESVRGPVHALADERYEGACELLTHLGFVPLQQGVYQWPAPQPTSQPR